jgi:hypothetical protein
MSTTEQIAREVLRQIMGSGGLGSTERAVGSTPNYSYGHGPGGIFSYPGMDQDVFSAMLLPYQGLQTRLPVIPNVDTNPIYSILTGVTATTGDEPDGVCDDPPEAGLAKLCMTSVPFGRYSRQTRVFDIDDFGRRVNRGEMFDYRLMNLPMMEGTTPMPTPAGTSVQNMLNNDVSKAVFELAVAWARDFAKLIYIGDPTNNSAGGGYKEFWGLARLINDGYQDAESGMPCAAADSYVKDFGSLAVETNGTEVIKWFSQICRYLKHKAIRTGLWPVKWVIVMSYALFYQITEIWPCAYGTYRCQFDNSEANARLVIDGMAQTQMRDDMRGNLESMTGQYLLIDGVRYEVVLDDAIIETPAGGGSFTSTAWFVPLTVLGRRAVTYMEHFDYRTEGGAMEAARILAGGDFYYTSDAGRFLWHRKPPTNWCVQLLAKTQPRLVVRTPFIAARLDNIKYTPVDMFQSWDPDSDYYKNGGRTSRSTPSLYPPTAE